MGELLPQQLNAERIVIAAKAESTEILNAGSVIPDLARNRQDGVGRFNYRVNKININF